MVEKELTQVQRMEKYGVVGKPIPVTRALVSDIPGWGRRGPVENPKSLIMINDQEGYFSAGNIYHDDTIGWKFGNHYDPSTVRHPIPAANSKHWRKWSSKGYVELKPEEIDKLEVIKKAA